MKNGYLLQNSTDGVAREVRYHPLVRITHGRRVPEMVVGHERPQQTAKTTEESRKFNVEYHK